MTIGTSFKDTTHTTRYLVTGSFDEHTLNTRMNVNGLNSIEATDFAKHPFYHLLSLANRQKKKKRKNK